MSVKNEKKNRISSSIRDYQNSHQVNTQYQVINCINNKLQLNKKLIEIYTIHLVALCYQKTIKTQMKGIQTKAERQQKTQKNNERNCHQFTLQIQGTNLYVTKALVKHSFTLQNYLNENIQFLRFQIPESDSFVIQNYSFLSPLAKSGLKVSLISDQIGLHQRSNKFCIIKPLELIQENMRIRAMKLSKSNSKSFNFESQSTKTLNLKWNTQTSHQSPPKNFFNQIKDKRKSSIGNSSHNLYIRGVEYKKSMQKLERDNSRSFSRVQKHAHIKNSGAMKILQKSKNNHNKLNVSMSNKLLNNSSCFDRKRQDSIGFIYSKKCSIQNLQDQLSSESYYTAKKGLDNEIQIPQRIQPKKFTIQTTCKQNNVKQIDARTTSKNFSKLGSTLNQLRNTRQSQSSKLNSMNSSINLQGKKFNKNICQAKIAQVSRTLLNDDKNILSRNNINLSRNQK